MPTNRPSGDEVIVIQQNRAFLQFGGPRPGNPTKYYGLDTNYAVLKGVTLSDSGTITPHYTGDPRRQGEYRLIARTKAAPALPKATLHLLEKRGVLNRQLGRIGCAFNAYVVSGDCKDLSDFLYGWSNYVQVYSEAIVGDKNLGDRGDWGADKTVEDLLPLTLVDIYPIGAVGFGAAGATQVVTEVVDIVYGNMEQCGDCGPANDGTLYQYAVQLAPEGGSATCLYSLDGGGTWTSQAITGIGIDKVPSAIDIVGDKLVILVAEENAYYWSTLNQATGAPGSSWTKVTTGFVALKLPNDMVVFSPREVYFCADGGYIYKSTDITAGVTVVSAAGATSVNLERISGQGDVIVAAGASAKVLVSLNRGISWSVTAADPGAATLQALEVMDGQRFWVGNSAGAVYYTLNGGATWTQKSLPNSPADIRDIVFVNNEVGWIVGATVTPTALLYSTWNGGQDWTTHATAPRIVNYSSHQRTNRIAVPQVSDNLIACNFAILAGLGTAADGFIGVGAANVF